MVTIQFIMGFIVFIMGFIMGFYLIEIVTDPDFTSEDQVMDWLKKLMTTLAYIKAINKESGVW